MNECTYVFSKPCYVSFNDLLSSKGWLIQHNEFVNCIFFWGAQNWALKCNAHTAFLFFHITRVQSFIPRNWQLIHCSSNGHGWGMINTNCVQNGVHMRSYPMLCNRLSYPRTHGVELVYVDGYFGGTGDYFTSSPL